MAAQDLTTLDHLKDWFPISSTNKSDDAQLGRLITSVSQDFMRATKRPDLLLTNYQEVHDGDGSSRLILFHWPINAIDLLTVGDAVILESTDKVAPGWYFDTDIDPERIWNVYLKGFVFGDGVPVKVEYSAGYTPVGGTQTDTAIILPLDIELAVLEWCAYRYKKGPNAGTNARKSLEGDSVQVENVDAPANVIEVIKRYERCVPSVDRRGDMRMDRMTRAQQRAQARS